MFMMTSSNAYVMMARGMRSIFPGRSHIPCYPMSPQEVLKECHAVIQEQLDAGIVERVQEDGAAQVGEVHFLAHHLVVGSSG